MCGIVGYIGSQNALPILLEGLHQLEYRGYDSAGVALQRSGGLQHFKKVGKVNALRDVLPKRSAAQVGIGHTRWATHGVPSDTNAHPHLDASGEIALIHNGIIENAGELRAHLNDDGYHFASETDTEVLVALIAREYQRLTESVERSSGDNPLVHSVTAALRQVTGAYGVAVLHAQHPKEIVVARNGSPVVLGVGDREMFIASDAAALVRHTRRVVYLDDGDVALVRAGAFEVTDLSNVPSARAATDVEAELALPSKGEFDHFTLKETAEQPEVLRRVLSGRLDHKFSTTLLAGLNLEPRDLLGFERIKIIGCGSAFISARLGASLIERLARVPTDAEPAAEFRYRNPIIEPRTLYFAVSQSGETFDTLAAVQEIKRKGGTVRGIVNVVGSAIARECDGGVYLHAGPEVAVVSTKTFTATVLVFALVALHLGRLRDVSPAEGSRILSAMEQLPEMLEALLADLNDISSLSGWVSEFSHAYFIGRNEGYALAMEGALKLKEVSYVHAEAYPASELKHGPLALIDKQTLTVAVLPDDDLLSKNLSTLEEIKARSGPLLVIGQMESAPATADHYVRVPKLHSLLDPLLLLLPLQLLAYYVALARDCDVDRPRNLAKSVTVE